MKALLVGSGKMGGALLQSWVADPDTKFTVVDPVVSEVAGDAQLVRAIEDLDGELFDIIFVAIKPQMIDDILPLYKGHLADNGIVASIAAGCSIERLKAAMGDVAIIRIMPNLPAAIGKGVSGLYANAACSDAHRASIDKLMNLTGTNVWIETEDGIDRVTAVAGSGPGYVFEIARTFIEAAQTLGFSLEQARDLVLGTMEGAVEMARNSTESTETLRNNVTSKNGTTEAGLNALNGDGTLSRLMKATVDAAYNRAVELR